MYRHLCLALLMTLGLLQGERHVAQAESFTFTPIDVPGASDTQPLGINPSGQIVGFYISPVLHLHGFLYDGGVFTTIDVPGAFLTEAYGINPSGQIVGFYGDSAGAHGFLYDGGVFTTIDPPGATFDTQASGINPRGQIVGFYGDSTGAHGFLATPKKK
jgi:uncharacterized membrane protein